MPVAAGKAPVEWCVLQKNSEPMILAIDFGSTSFKTGLFDRKLRQVGGGSAPVRYRYASGGRVELDVPVAEETLRRALPKKLDGIEAIEITSQAQTFTVL